MRGVAFTFFLFLHLNASGQLYSTGLVFNDDKYERATIKANLNADVFKDLPISASLKKYCPKPGNQLQLNTSPSWATSWSAKTILDAIKNNWTDQKFITHQTYSPAYTYYHIRKADDETCEAGADLFDALQFLKNNQTKMYDEFLEFCPRGIPGEILPTNSKTTISDFAKLFDDMHNADYKINAVKKSLSENLPVVIGMHCPPSFYNAKNCWQPSELASIEYPGHSLCIIGYDDNKYGGAFEIINSWGKSWGNDGFLWIRYQDFVNFTRYAYEVFTIDKSSDGTFDFSGSINLKLNNRSEIILEKIGNGIFKTALPLLTGSYFRIYIKNENPVFIYVFGIDESNNFFRIFPHQENISPALIYWTDEVAIPGEDNYIEIIGEPGQEKLCILYSKEPLDFNQLLYNLEKYPGVVDENLDALLEGKIISPGDILWTDQGIGFYTKSPTKTAFFIQININHI